MRIFGIILAGGQGRRMGHADKAFLRLADRPLIEHAIARLEPQVERLAISANGDPARFAPFALPILADDTSLGPLSGVLAGLDWAAADGADALVTAAVDTPFFPCDLVPQLLLAAGTGMAVAQSDGRAHPTFALWPVSLRGALREALAKGQAKVMTFVESQGANRADFSVGIIDPFFNLNTPGDLANAESVLHR